MSKHLAPNGEPSNLTHEQWHLVRTPEFKAWFGDWENSPENASKVVDENGEPLVVYHATNNDYNEFSYKYADRGNGAYASIGFYFTAYKQYKSSSIYGKIIKKCFLNLRNPMIVAGLEFKNYSTKSLSKSQIIKLIGKRNPISDFYGSKENVIDKLLWKRKRTNENYETYYESSPIERQLHYIWEVFYSDESIEVFQKSVIKNLKYDGAYIYNNDYLVAFLNTQIKLADGTNTTFDSNNPDIRYADGGRVDGLNIIIKNISDHSKKYLGVYKKIFDIIEENIAFFNPYGTSYEEIKGNDFYITITPVPEQSIVDKISKIKNVEIVENFHSNIRYKDGGNVDLIYGEIYSGKQVRDIVSKYGSQQGTDMIDFTTENIKIKDKYILDFVKVRLLIDNDINLHTFISEEYEPGNKVNYQEITEPILLGYDKWDNTPNVVLDGYHRVLQASYNNQEEILAFINLKTAEKIRYFKKGGNVNSWKYEIGGL
jgi:hypothetical protein